MSTITKNLGLVKPELTDPADIKVLNDNFDKIDEAVVKKDQDLSMNGYKITDVAEPVLRSDVATKGFVEDFSIEGSTYVAVDEHNDGNVVLRPYVPLVDNFATEDEIYHGCYYRMVDGNVEWLNPPMELGVEYRTTERWFGEVVYVKSVDCGPLPEFGKTKNVRHSENNVVRQMVRVSGQLNVSDDGTAGGDCLPYYNPDIGLEIDITASRNAVKITNAPAAAISQELPACTVTAQVWYVKDEIILGDNEVNQYG